MGKGSLKASKTEGGSEPREYRIFKIFFAKRFVLSCLSKFNSMKKIHPQNISF